jgi:hypothetical protein
LDYDGSTYDYSQTLSYNSIIWKTWLKGQAQAFECNYLLMFAPAESLSAKLTLSVSYRAHHLRFTFVLILDDTCQHYGGASAYAGIIVAMPMKSPQTWPFLVSLTIKL